MTGRSADTSDRRPVLVTGGAGFIGSNLANRLAGAGHSVIVYDALARAGVERNLTWLEERHGGRIERRIADLRDVEALTRAAREAKAVFHLAAQVAVTTSLADPRDDFEVNALGTLNLLEALRGKADGTPVIFASTNKVYGDLADIELTDADGRHLPADAALRASGIGEDRPLDFHTPYGCSKGAADQYVLDYARSYGVPSAVMRMSCIYGERQMGTEDQGWVAHFLIRALKNKPISIYGDGRQVRDVLDVADAVDAYLGVWDRIEELSGSAFNLGGGPENAVSLRQVIEQIEALTGRQVEVRFDDWRAGDQRFFVADTRKLEGAIKMGAKTPWKEGIARLARWLKADRSGARAPTGSPALRPQTAGAAA